MGLVLLAFEGGLRFGKWRSQRPGPEPQLPARSLVASILSMLAFILGFTFGQASRHYDDRQQSIFNEGTAIRTAYHRADLIPDPERTRTRQLLRAYVDLRLEAGRPGDLTAVPRLRQMQDEMWDQVTTLQARASPPPSAASLAQSVIDVIDVHGERVLAGIRARIPFGVWFFLYAIMSVAVASAGYHSGLASARGRSATAVGYALVFSAVLMLIAIADVPGSGQRRTAQQVLKDLRSRLAEE